MKSGRKWFADHIVQLFFCAGMGFAFSFAKLFLLPKDTVPMVVAMETLSMLFFLALLFVAVLYFQKREKELKTSEQNYNKEKEKWKQENKYLKGLIDDYERKENETKRFASYQERMLKKLFSGNDAISDRKYFLHLLASSFSAGAAILYKEDKQSGTFTVEESYALPEDFTPKPFEPGEGMNGQAVTEMKPVVADNVESGILQISSGLGTSSRGWLYCLPVIKEAHCIYLVEMITFSEAGIDKMWNEISARLVEMEILQ